MLYAQLASNASDVRIYLYFILTKLALFPSRLIYHFMAILRLNTAFLNGQIFRLISVLVPEI